MDQKPIAQVIEKPKQLPPPLIQPVRSRHYDLKEEKSMDQKQIAKQMLEFKESAWDSTFSVMTMFQEQTEKMVNLYLDQAIFLPKEGKKMVTEWLNAGKKGSESFRKMMEDGFKTAESYFA
jgi:hypothetical protein